MMDNVRVFEVYDVMQVGINKISFLIQESLLQL